jgi:hypothetical protein
MGTPYLSYDEITDNAVGGGLVENPKLSQTSNSLLMALCVLGRLRWVWESPLEKITDAQFDNILDIIRDAEGELMVSYAIGAIIPSLVDMDLEYSLLRLDGQTVAQADYPELALICPVAWLVSTNIVLPNLDTTSLHGGYGNVGGIVGANTHQLTVAELASHTHTQTPHTHVYNNPLTVPALGGAIPATASLVVPTPLITAPTTAVNLNSGGDTPHNNVPESVEVIYYLVSR